MLLCILLNDVSNWLKLGHNPASKIYLEKKQEAAEECGLKGQARFLLINLTTRNENNNQFITILWDVKLLECG